MLMRLIVKAIYVMAVAFSMGQANAASLYQEQKYQSLTSDRKAHQVGDSITVIVYENSSATSTANTSASRNAGVGVDYQTPTRSLGGNLKLNNDHDGRGTTQREGRVLAQITVTVQEIGGNGDLFISGQQKLEINNELQQIRVEGWVRPQDISNANTVLSTRIAEAKLSYVGEGDLADRQRPGWWQRVLTWFGL